MNNRKNLAEYLFLDRPRIERYFQQLSEPVKYDKVPVWKVALGLAGPSVEGAQDRPAREFTFEEKLQKVLSHIESEKLLAKTRQRRPDIEDIKPFIVETVSARRARIEREGTTLNIWVSLRPDHPGPDTRHPNGALYLIEDFRGEDEYPHIFSGYSSLWLLAEELAWVGGTPLVDPIEQLQRQDEAMRHFASDPIGSLKSIGAQFGPERPVYSIYRFRASCIEEQCDEHSVTTIGYPLVVREI
ncbi:MAG TPA: hypothetical protein VIP46_18835 [Pyrinomonadaceae bacterium]